MMCNRYWRAARQPVRKTEMTTPEPQVQHAGRFSCQLHSVLGTSNSEAIRYRITGVSGSYHAAWNFSSLRDIKFQSRPCRIGEPTAFLHQCYETDEASDEP